MAIRLGHDLSLASHAIRHDLLIINLTSLQSELTLLCLNVPNPGEQEWLKLRSK